MSTVKVPAVTPEKRTKPQRRTKVIGLNEAAAMVHDGAHLAIGGMALHNQPMAFIRELIRQGRRDLTVIGDIMGLEVDTLAGARALSRVEGSGVGLERYGLAKNFRRGVQAGEIQMADFSDYMSLDRIVAARENLPFYPVAYLAGTDIPKHLHELKPFKCPITGQDLYAMPPAKIDFAIIHAPYADKYGNVLFSRRPMMLHSQDLMMARAADKVLVTVEKIISTDLVRQNPYLNQIPTYRSTAVVEVPWGAHPSSMPDFYNMDEQHLEEYVASSGIEDDVAAYLKRYVFDVDDHIGYLDRVGIRNLLATRNVMVL